MSNILNKIKKEIGNIIPGEVLEEISTNFKLFLDSLGPEDKPIADPANLAIVKKKLFKYEKKYLPLLEENKKVSEEFKPDNLLLTVGLQAEPLILSILCLKPRKIYLLHSGESRKNADEVANDPDIKKLNPKISFTEITEYDAIKNYGIIREILSNLSKKSKTVVDPTGGRKIMISSLSLAAFYYRLPMVYMHGKDIKGKTVPFTDRLRKIENPFECYGDIELQLIEELFNSHFYEAALKTCENLLKSIKDLATSKRIELLIDLISIYRDWDAFLHSAVPEKLKHTLSKRLEDTVNDFKRFNISNWLPENIDKNLEFLKQLDSKWKNSYNIVDEFRLVDIYLSALRRGSEKQAKYDDAIARLYRCLEMSASLKLYGKDLKSTEHPDYNSFVKKLGITREELEYKFTNLEGRQLPEGNLGLDNQITLLKIVDENDTIVKIYESMEGLVRMRNRSILAHGTYPATEKDWTKFRDKTIQILMEVLGQKRFNELLDMGWHRKISLKAIS